MLILSIFLRSECKTLRITHSYPRMSRPVSPLNTMRVVQTHKASSLTPFSSSKNGGLAFPRLKVIQVTESDVKMTVEMPLERN